MQFLLELDYIYLMYTMRGILGGNLYFLNWKDWKQISKGRKGDEICFLFEKNNNVIDKLITRLKTHTSKFKLFTSK